MSKKTEFIINDIHELLQTRHHTLYGHNPKKSSLEFQILNELTEIKKTLSLKETLIFSNLMLQLDQILVSKEQKLWRAFVYCHLVYLFQKRVLVFNPYLLGMICDAITKENIKKDFRYLLLLSDEKWMSKLLEHTLFIDFTSSLTNKYQIDLDRIKRVFLFFCKQIRELLYSIPEETKIEEVKKEIFKKLKSYQPNQLFKRSVMK